MNVSLIIKIFTKQQVLPSDVKETFELTDEEVEDWFSPTVDDKVTLFRSTKDFGIFLLQKRQQNQ